MSRGTTKTIRHPTLGLMTFESRVGWTTHGSLNGRSVELVFGSDGDIPTDDHVRIMLQILDTWNVRWQDHAKTATELQAKWPAGERISVDSLTLASLQQLWPDDADCVMAYFEINPMHNDRHFHLTLRNGNTVDFAFDH